MLIETIWSSSTVGRYSPPSVDMKSSAFAGAVAANALGLLLALIPIGERIVYLLDNVVFVCDKAAHLKNLRLSLL